MAELTPQQIEELDHVYGHHSPTPEQVAQYAAITEAAKNFERVVLMHCPPGADRTFTTRQIREARMTANRAIALHRPDRATGILSQLL